MLKYASIRDFYFKEHGQLFEYYFLSYRAKPLTIEAVERVVRIAGESNVLWWGLWKIS